MSDKKQPHLSKINEVSDEIDQLPNISAGNQGLLSNQSEVNYFFP